MKKFIWTAFIVSLLPLIGSAIFLKLFQYSDVKQVPEPLPKPRQELGRHWAQHDRPWRHEWDILLEHSIDNYAPHLWQLDIRCPNDPTVEIPIMDLMRAMAWAESSNRPEIVFTNDKGKQAIGLFQLDYDIAKNYKIPVGNLKIPGENIIAAVRVLGHLTRDYEDSVCGFFKAGGRYWEVLQPGECFGYRTTPWVNLTKELELCL